MPSLLRVLALAASTLVSLVNAGPVSASVAGQVVPGKWIVTLQPDADVATVSSHLVKVREIRARSVGERGDESGEIQRQYGFGMFKGYAGVFDEAMVEELEALPEVGWLSSTFASSMEV
ncbi:hypothetical protein PMIN07_009802 [Paraphaeosphaeria minitans]